MKKMKNKDIKKKNDNLIENELLLLSSKFSKNDTLVIILAAGHGKRIRSSTSKMLHTIWGVPSIERVRLAVNNGIPKSNVTIVVGIKALDVANAVGKQPNTNFAYQESQMGTGHAVRIGLEKSDLKNISEDFKNTKDICFPISGSHCFILYFIIPLDIGVCFFLHQCFHIPFKRFLCNALFSRIEGIIDVSGFFLPQVLIQ